MRPLTETIPKAMLDVAGEPFIAHQLRLLKAQNIARVVICAGYLAEQIEAFVGDGAAFGLQVTVQRDGDKLLGTGGALRRALPLLGDMFFVTYGDAYLMADYSAVYDAFRKSGQPALMAVFHNQNSWDKSNARFDGQRVTYNKLKPDAGMHYIDWGLSLFKAGPLMAYPPDTKFDLSEVFEALSRSHQLAGLEVTQRFYEIGSPEGLAALDQFLRSKT